MLVFVKEKGQRVAEIAVFMKAFVVILMAPDTPVLVGAITLGSHMSHMDSLLLSARAGATALLARHPEGLLPVCGDSCILA